MARPLESKYSLDRKRLDQDSDLTAFSKCLTDFKFFCANAAQIVSKDREKVPVELNEMQLQFEKVLAPLIDIKTRPKHHVDVVWVKPRQGGGTVGIVELNNFLATMVKGLTHMTILHILQSGGAAKKLYDKKVKPIVQGVRPELMATIYERNSSQQGITLYYDNYRGVERDNSIEFLSSNSSSIRSDTVHIAIYDEYDSYRKPADLEDAVQGALPKNSFSLSIYISTVSERGHLLRKAKMAKENPDVMKFIFTPWFVISDYEDPDTSHYDLKNLHLTKQEKLICTEMKKWGIPPSKWFHKLEFYRKELIRFGNDLDRMIREYPTCEKELFDAAGENDVFDRRLLKKMEQEIAADPIQPERMRIMMDPISAERQLAPSPDSPFYVYKRPEPGRSYWLLIDPIDSKSSSSDYFYGVVVDRETLEEVAWLRTRDLSYDDYTEWVYNVGHMYNYAEVVPERNRGSALLVLLKNRGYRRIWYGKGVEKIIENAGVYTTSNNKASMIEKLDYLIRIGKYKIRDPQAIEEFKHYIKRFTASGNVQMQADGVDSNGEPFHDDSVMARAMLGAIVPEYKLKSEDDIRTESLNIFG